ncbi:IS630 family transposase [uncultured Rubinisphaera sp.]|uniref:IS630 family transposase n=1 Tax=uncultured Rubinisphaera sp. TaxID=1678686 RepID=UPI0030D82675
MRVAKSIVLSEAERVQLTKWSRGRSTPTRLVQRAKIVLLAVEGTENKDIASQLQCTRRTVSRWRNRFAQLRLSGIEKDAPRAGRKPSVRAKKEAEIVRKTTQETPPGATHWSTRTMAKAVGVSRATVQRVWRDNGLKPHRTKTFKVSNDPKFAEKLVDVVGLYLNPPEHALVLSCDEKSQIQALDRTQKSLPMFPGRLGTMTHDYKRHGTTTLFAALSVTDGTLITQCQQRHRHQEWIKFLETIDRETVPEFDLHLIVDNYATHKHPKVQRWLTRHPRFHVHFIPTSSSWLNVIERVFSELTSKRLKRGTFRSVEQLETAIEEWVELHNENPRGINWKKTADQILEKVTRAKAALDKCLSE